MGTGCLGMAVRPETRRTTTRSTMTERDQSPRLSDACDAATVTEGAWPKPTSAAVIVLASAAAWALILLTLLA